MDGEEYGSVVNAYDSPPSTEPIILFIFVEEEEVGVAEVGYHITYHGGFGCYRCGGREDGWLC